MDTPPIGSGGSVSARQVTTRLSSPHRSSTFGFLLTDTALKLLSANDEAIAILTFEQGDREYKNLAKAFERKLRRNLLRKDATTISSAFAFISGRRTYFCRAFLLNATENAPNDPAVLLVLERGSSESMALSQMARRFRLTRREQQVVALLAAGLSNKEMAERMAISHHTVKALVHMVMAKMRAPSRNAVVALIFQLISNPELNRMSPSAE